MSRNRGQQPVIEDPGCRGTALIASEPPGYWSSHFVLELETALTRTLDPVTSPEKITTAAHLLYLHYVDRLDWFDAERVLSRVVDHPGAARKTFGDCAFDQVNPLHAIHLSLWGKNRLGGRSALGRISSRSSIQRTPLAEGARAAICLASGDYENAVALAEKAKRTMTSKKAISAIDRLMISRWDQIIVGAHGALRPKPLSGSVTSSPVMGGLIAFPVERPNLAPIGDRFAWDPGVPSDYRAEWIWRRRPAGDLTA